MSSCSEICIHEPVCALDYFVEGHRFDILEDIGCYPAIYATPLALVLVLCWPLVIGVVSAVYGCKSHIF
jgi:pheromone a factor receptor